MVEQERRHATIGFVQNASGEGIEPSVVKISFGGIPCVLPRVVPTQTFVIFLAIMALIGICQSSIFESPEQNNCFGILVFSSILWAFEAIPLFVTSMIIPGLIVILRVMNVNGERLDSKSAAKLIFSGNLKAKQECLDP